MVAGLVSAMTESLRLLGVGYAASQLSLHTTHSTAVLVDHTHLQLIMHPTSKHSVHACTHMYSHVQICLNQTSALLTICMQTTLRKQRYQEVAMLTSPNPPLPPGGLSQELLDRLTADFQRAYFVTGRLQDTKQVD